MQKATTILLLIFTAVSFTTLTAAAQDQNGGSSRISISASAQVVESIEMVTLRDISFSPVQPSQQTITIDPLSDTNTGKMVALGNADSQIRVSFVRERTLTHDSGTNSLTFTYEIAGNDEDDQSSAEILQTDNRDLTLNGNGEYYFWIGGQVNVENAKPGNYNGDFTIEVEYI
ncbi:DUF4402 domain-containing protein [Fodinibius sp.]|uniref:DUF4402 domain-containing protein n=1 Tax=Fodinibius sp. TaxID=1872440 RepID=UPI002ACDB15D|nr:DUF4402 domain-containing protein [Fodinibius sp.]MDZ7657749.1 DUF4402 domain-containing protein [Fodinibius sp.]